MSFISIDDRAPWIGRDASPLTHFILSKAVFSPGFSTKIAVLLIALLLPCALAEVFMTLNAQPVAAPSLVSDLHPTCSAEHDCWIAASPVEKSIERVAAPVHTAEGALPKPITTEPMSSSVAGAEPAGLRQSFGALAPGLRWSGPPASQADTSHVASASHRLSVAMLAASAKTTKHLTKQANAGKSQTHRRAS